MYISGFTFIRNAIKYDYPIVEAIKSILPLCQEVVVAVGQSDDDTLALIQSIQSPKIKIIQTTWDDTLKAGGAVLAAETNKALAAINPNADWCIYIQGDECIHEKYHQNILESMAVYKDDDKVDGLLLKYKHFFGSYDYIGTARRWYRHEIRIIKNNPNISSYKDAQGFRFNDNTKLNVKRIDAEVYHYGWVRPPAIMQSKDLNFNTMYHSQEWIEKHKQPEVAEFDYSSVDSVAAFEGTHPAVMQPRIAAVNWHFSTDPSRKNVSLKEKLFDFVEQLTSWRIGEYKNYKVV